MVLNKILTKLIILFFFPPCLAIGADYYVDSSTGDNSNVGSSAAPWEDLAYADDMVAAGDVVYVSGTHRDNFYPENDGSSGNEITFTGNYIVLGSVDVSEGISSINYIDNGSFDGWIDTSTPWDMVATPNGSTIAQESTIVPPGATYSLEMDKSGSTPSVVFDIFLPASTNITFAYKHYQTQTDKRPAFDFWDRTANERYDFDLSTWTEGGSRLRPTNSVDTWSDASVTLDSQSAGRYTITITMPDTATPATYICDLSITLTSAYTWEVHSGDTYKLENAIPSAGVLLKSNVWDSQGPLSLAYATLATSLANCISTENTWWFESDVLYYHIDAGETIADVHFEFSRITSRGDTTQLNICQVDNDYIIAENFYCIGSHEIGLSAADADTLVLNNSSVRHSGTFNYGIGGTTTATLNNCSGFWSFTEDNIAVGGTANVVLNNFESGYSWDEGIEAFLDGTITCNVCLSYFAGQNGISSTDNFSATNTADLILNSVVGYGSSGGGVSIGEGAEDTCTGIIKNSIFWSNGTDARAGAGAVTITIDNSIWSSEDAEWTSTATGSNNLASDPQFVSSTDFRLKQNSPARKTGLGTKHNGLPSDIGAYQTSESIMHHIDVLKTFYSPGYPIWLDLNEVILPVSSAGAELYFSANALLYGTTQLTF